MAPLLDCGGMDYGTLKKGGERDLRHTEIAGKESVGQAEQVYNWELRRENRPNGHWMCRTGVALTNLC